MQRTQSQGKIIFTRVELIKEYTFLDYIKGRLDLLFVCFKSWLSLHLCQFWDVELLCLRPFVDSMACLFHNDICFGLVAYSFFLQLGGMQIGLMVAIDFTGR